MRRYTIGGRAASNLYIPTATPITNVASLNALVCYWFRFGNFVIIHGQVQVNPTATGSTRVDISLPFSSGFFATAEATGVVASSAGEAGQVFANTADDRLSLIWVTVDTSDHNVAFNCAYAVSP